MMPKLLVIVQAPFSERDFHRFGISSLQMSFCVTIADATAWLAPPLWHEKAAIQFVGAGCINVSSESDFRTLIKTGFDYILEMAMLPIGCERELVRLGIKRVKLSSGEIPCVPSSWKKRILDLRLRTRKIHVIKQALIARLKLRKPTPPDYVLATCRQSATHYPQVRHRMLYAHALDYDVYLELRDQPKPTGEKYWVYLDQDPCYHSDNLIEYYKWPATPSLYYARLLTLFEQWERINACKIAFASHPRSDWNKHMDLLGGRQPLHGKTAELVKNSSGVFAHYSTSISFAVLWRKPIVLLTTDELEKSFFRDEMLVRQKMLRTALLNFDHLEGIDLRAEVLARVDDEAYAEYQANFIKLPGTPDLPAWCIWSQELLGQEATATGST